MIKQFYFYKSYADTINALTNSEEGQYIKKLCEYMFRDKALDEQAEDKIDCLLLLGEDEFRENKEVSVNNGGGRKEKRFAFRSTYANVFFFLKDGEAGILIKQMIGFMFGGNRVTAEESKTVVGYFNAMKKSLASSKKQAENACKRTKRKPPEQAAETEISPENEGINAPEQLEFSPITSDSIKSEFNLPGNLRSDNQILDGVSLLELREYIENNEEVRTLNYYKIVEKFRAENGL